jgi:hypothetical protein
MPPPPGLRVDRGPDGTGGMDCREGSHLEGLQGSQEGRGPGAPPRVADYGALTMRTLAGALSATLGAGDAPLDGPALTLSTSTTPVA